MHPIKLGRAVIPTFPSSATGGPASIDEIVGNIRIHQFKQGGRTSRREVGIHARKPIAVILTRQQ